MKLTGRRVGWVNSNGMSSVQVWTYFNDKDSKCLGVLCMPTTHFEGRAEFEIAKEDFKGLDFSKCACSHEEVSETDSKKEKERKKDRSQQVFRFST